MTGKWFREMASQQIMKIHKNDYDIYQALDMDSSAVSESKSLVQAKDSCRKIDEQASDDDGYSQDIPSYRRRLYRYRTPPIIPPHLDHSMLNENPIRKVNSEYPELLRKPCHSLLNHLYVTSMNEGVMALSSTQRYREKFVTTIFYRPISDPS